jgi:hypothetical protein
MSWLDAEKAPLHSLSLCGPPMVVRVLGRLAGDVSRPEIIVLVRAAELECPFVLDEPALADTINRAAAEAADPTISLPDP